MGKVIGQVKAVIHRLRVLTPGLELSLPCARALQSSLYDEHCASWKHVRPLPKEETRILLVFTYREPRVLIWKWS